jgi:integrase
MQMNRKSKDELIAILTANNWRHGRKDKGVAYATAAKRAQFLWQLFKQLHQNLNMPLMPHSFRMKHVKATIRFWEQKGHSAGTMQTEFSYLKVYSCWIGKAGMITGTLADYLQNPQAATRVYAAQYDKSWQAKGIDVYAKIAEIALYDKYVAAQLLLQLVLGLRIKEACMCRPYESDQGTVFLIEHGTKGGRKRSVPIDTAEKRAAIDHAKSLLDHPSLFLADPSKTLKQNMARYYNTLAKFGLTKAGLGVTGHGLRTGYGLDLYEKETGEPAPVRGGSKIPRTTDQAARLTVAAHYGHGRTSISTAYLGAVLQRPAQSQHQVIADKEVRPVDS